MLSRISDKSALMSEAEKEYWMVRTEDGELYDQFVENNFIAIKVPFVGADLFYKINKDGLNEVQALERIRQHLKTAYEEYKFNDRSEYSQLIDDLDNNRTVGLRTSQLYNFVYKIKCGDIVIVPSTGAYYLSIGKVVDTDLLVDDSINKEFRIAKKVKWLTRLSKSKLDPCLYKALGAHQAISNISVYKEYIERNYNSYFVKDDEYHFVLSITSDDISAKKLFGLGSELLKIVENIKEKAAVLDVDVEELNMSINLNSPGKIDFKCKNVKLAILIIAVTTTLSGGRLTYDKLNFQTKGLFESLVKAINEFRKESNDIEIQKKVVDSYMTGLKVQTVENGNKAMQDNSNEK